MNPTTRFWLVTRVPKVRITSPAPNGCEALSKIKRIDAILATIDKLLLIARAEEKRRNQLVLELGLSASGSKSRMQN